MSTAPMGAGFIARGRAGSTRAAAAACGRPSVPIARTTPCYRRALELADDLSSRVPALVVCGDVHWELGELDRAETHAGRSAQALGLLDRAVEHYLTGLGLCRQHSEPVEEAGCLANLAGAYRDLGRFDDALRTARESLAISTRIGMPRAQTSARHVLGSTYFRLGRHDEALAELRAALEHWTAAVPPAIG